MGKAWDSDDSWTWQEAVKKFRSLGFSINYIIDFGIGVDFKNSTKHILRIDESLLEISREYLIKGINDTVVASYWSYIVDMAVLFGADKAVATKELGESLQFEMDLANISLSMEERRNFNDLYNPTTIRELQKSYPYVQWLNYINALLPKGLTVDEDERINVLSPTFLIKLAKLLSKTPKRVIANYMMWRIHAASVDFLSDDFRKPQREFRKALDGNEEEQARWKECVDLSSNELSLAVSSLYVRKYFKEESKAMVKEIMNNIRGAFDKRLDDLDWMDDLTKKHAKAKLQSMRSHIGYPDELLDESKIAEYYRNLNIDSKHYLDSYLRMNIFSTDYAFNKLRFLVNQFEWLNHANSVVVNAFYSPFANSLELPAGILQGAFFNARRPKYMNYGAIGSIIGHEITHGFDDRGRHLDLEGNLVDWWKPQAAEAYLKKAKCIIDQYGNYTEPLTDLKLNGINTQGENIADNGGLRVSYLAYKNWAAKNDPEPKLPGLDYTSEQMFWISAAHLWCAKSRKEFQKKLIKTDAHSPDGLRILGSFRNMKYFAKDFHCPEGSPMNPVQKCEVF